jgi:hypothetical protein
MIPFKFLPNTVYTDTDSIFTSSPFPLAPPSSSIDDRVGGIFRWIGEAQLIKDFLKNFISHRNIT